MSTLAIIVGVIGLLCAVATAVIHFKVIPDLAKKIQDEDTLNKVLLYGKIYIGLAAVTALCVLLLLIMGIVALFSGSSKPMPLSA